MTHYLRRNGRTIVDVETMKDDLRSVVCIEQYSYFYYQVISDQAWSKDKREYRDADINEVIKDFNDLSELRGEWFEQPRVDKDPTALAERRMREIGEKYKLEYVTD